MDVRSKTLCSEKVTTDKVSWQNGSVAYTNIFKCQAPPSPSTHQNRLFEREIPSLNASRPLRNNKRLEGSVR